MSSVSTVVDRSAFARDGWIVVRGVLSRGDAARLADHARSLVERGGNDEVSRRQIQTQYDRRGRARLVKVNQLTTTDPTFSALASRPAVVDVVEDLIGPGARIFRDVLIVKPAESDGVFSYHQDSAYWDVEPRALVSCWLAATDVPEEASCLRVIPRSHDRLRRHGLMVGERPLPQPAVDLLRKLVSYAGTGDNPGGAGGNATLWAMKRLVLARATRLFPGMSALQDYRALPDEVDRTREVALPVRAGDAIFFHSLLLHASGPNRTSAARYAPIISYMSRDARFVGKGSATFPRARRAQS
jgi:ectoine hydroxylase-related dioxygenase (phytanoyl-CoA dioxygenase family)